MKWFLSLVLLSSHFMLFASGKTTFGANFIPETIDIDETEGPVLTDGSGIDIGSGNNPDDEDSVIIESGDGTPETTRATAAPTFDSLCIRLRKEASRSNMLGVFIPHCDHEGNYQPVQCHASTGHCWCVNSVGEEVEGSRVPSKHLNCTDFIIHVASSASIEPSSTLSTKSSQIPTDSTTASSSTLLPTTTLKMSTEVATTTLQTQRSTSLRASTRAETTRQPSTASSRLVPVKHSTRTTLPKTTTRSTTVPEKSTVDDEFSWASPSKEPLEPINKIDQIPNEQDPSISIDQSEEETNDINDINARVNPQPRIYKMSRPAVLSQPGYLAVIIGGSVIVLLCAILFVMFIVYRLRKKAEPVYVSDRPTRSPTAAGYKKAFDKDLYS